MVLPTFDYPVISTHTQQQATKETTEDKTKAIRWRTEYRYRYSYRKEEIHKMTQTEPVSLRLAKQAYKTRKHFRYFKYLKTTQNKH